jgi:predicted HicB family RNase H-like nuclease
VFDIEHNGFVARLSLEGDLIRGEVMDIHEIIVIEGRSTLELRKDFELKIEAYCSRCERRGIQPFDTLDGKSRVRRVASGISYDDPLEWPHGHYRFFSTKADLMLDQILAVAKLKSHKLPSTLRLPIDDVIDILRNRRQTPKLLNEWKTAEGASNLLPWLRLYLQAAFRRVSAADPRNRDVGKATAINFLKLAQSLEVAGTNFLEQYGDLDGFPKFSRGLTGKVAHEHFVVTTEAENYLILFLERLAMMRSWALADLDTLAPEEGGRPRLIWKHDFVAAIAELWVMLTLKRPSSKPDALFAELVDAAWRSGGDDMPVEAWAEAIRAFCLSWHTKETDVAKPVLLSPLRVGKRATRAVGN